MGGGFAAISECLPFFPHITTTEPIVLDLMTFLILRMAINPNNVSRKEAGKKGRTVVKALKETSGGTLGTKA